MASSGEASNSTSLCYFGRYLQDKIPLNDIACDENVAPFLELQPDLRQIILSRCCLKHIAEETDLICEMHKNALGPKYRMRVMNQCRWPSHDHKRHVKNTKLLTSPFVKEFEMKQSMYLLLTHGILVPYESKVCNFCRLKFSGALLDSFDSEQFKTPESKSGLDMDADMESEVTSASMPLTQSSASGYSLPLELKQDERKATVDKLLTQNNVHVTCNAVLESNYNEVSERRKNQVKDYAGAAIASVIHSIIKNPEQDALFWQEMKDSEHVEKYLESQPPATAMLTEIILAYNCAASFQARVQIISCIVNIYSLKFLLKFNKKEKDMVINDDSESENEEDENEADCAKLAMPTNIFWSPTYTKHIHRESKLHYNEFDHAFAPVVKKQSYKWRIDHETVSIIMDFVMSPINTQNMAYGVINIKDETGKITPIARVIRYHNKSDMVNLIKSHLRDIGMPVPSSSFIFKLLGYMPAGKSLDIFGIYFKSFLSNLKHFEFLDGIFAII